MADTFEIVGTISGMSGDKIQTKETKSFDSGWTQSTTRINIKSGTNSILAMVQGGIFMENGKPKTGQKIYSFSKSEGDKKGEKLEIPFAERNQQKWVDKVATFKKLIIDTETTEDRKMLWAIRRAIESDKNLTDEQYKFLGVSTYEEATKAISERARKEYISEWDYSDAVYELVKSTDKSLWKVSGDIQISHNANTGEDYKNYIITKMERVTSDTEQTATVNMEFFFNKDSFDGSDWHETIVEGEKLPVVSGKAVVNGKSRYYYSNKQQNIKGTFGTDVVFEIPAKKSNLGIKKKLTNSFDKDVAWKSIKIKLNIIDGAEVVELTEDMLTEDQLLDIECGATTLEEIKRDMGGNIYGERVRKYTYNSLVNKSKGEEDTAFTDEDMSTPHSPEVEDDDEDIFS